MAMITKGCWKIFMNILKSWLIAKVTFILITPFMEYNLFDCELSENRELKLLFKAWATRTKWLRMKKLNVLDVFVKWLLKLNL